MMRLMNSTADNLIHLTRSSRSAPATEVLDSLDPLLQKRSSHWGPRRICHFSVAVCWKIVCCSASRDHDVGQPWLTVQ